MPRKLATDIASGVGAPSTDWKEPMKDAETVELDEVTLRGGWKLLCVQLLHHCVNMVAQERNLWVQQRRTGYETGLAKEGVRARSTGCRWMEGGCGAVTFEECCEAVGVAPDVARQRIEEYAHSRRREKPRYVAW